MNKEVKDIGKLFRDSFENYEAKPDAAAWNAIQKQLQPGFTFFGKKISYKAAFYVGLLTITSAILIGFGINQSNKTNEQQALTSTKIIEKQNVNSIESVQITENLTPQQSHESEAANKIEIQNQIVTEKVKSDTTKSIITTQPQEKQTVAPISITSVATNPTPQIKQPIKPITTIQNSTTPSNPIEVKPIEKVFTVCFGEECILTGETGNYTYKWSTGEISRSIKVVAQQSNNYTLTISNSSQVQTTINYSIQVDNECTTLFLPSAFSPNSDGKNDIFKGEGIGIQKFSIKILDKSGQVVFETDDLNQGWDGKIGGDYANSTFYFYFATYTDAKNQVHTKRGQLNLIR